MNTPDQNPSEVPTPLTDAEAHWHTSDGGWHAIEKTTPENGNWVPIKFARQLERELISAKARIAELEAKVELLDAQLKITACNLDIAVDSTNRANEQLLAQQEANAQFREALELTLEQMLNYAGWNTNFDDSGKELPMTRPPLVAVAEKAATEAIETPASGRFVKREVLKICAEALRRCRNVEGWINDGTPRRTEALQQAEAEIQRTEAR